MIILLRGLFIAALLLVCAGCVSSNHMPPPSAYYPKGPLCNPYASNEYPDTPECDLYSAADLQAQGWAEWMR